MVEYVDLPKGSDMRLFLKIWWIVVAKLTENIVCWFSIRFMLYTSMMWWIVTFSWEVIWWKYMNKFYDRVCHYYNNKHDASMSVFCFYRHLTLKPCGHAFQYRLSLEDKRGLSLGELIRPFCIMIFYGYLLCFVE